MELIKGKWYKLFDDYVKYSHCRGTRRKEAWYCERVYTNSGYSWEKISDWALLTNIKSEVPLSEIQQYLPEGHPDKEFVLPEKWYIVITRENKKTISEWIGTHEFNLGTHSCVHFNKDACDTYNVPKDYVQITFEQFKKYVLKTKEMEEREIIGYKLKDNKYTKNVKALLNAPEFDFQEFEDNRFKFTIALKELRDAGVLDLWFEPVFKEKFKIGDWVTWGSDVTGRVVKHCKIFADSWSLDVKGDLEQYDSCSESGLKLATPEEIKKTLIEEAIKRGFKGGVKIKTCFPDYSPVYTSDRSYKMNDCLPEYEQYLDALRMGGSIIYHKGKWAEILPNYPQIEINGYKGEFFDNYVKFGCAEIHKNIFIDLNTLNKDLVNGDGVIGMKSNRQIESITIGKGAFSKEQIKLIAEYYLNKK